MSAEVRLHFEVLAGILCHHLQEIAAGGEHYEGGMDHTLFQCVTKELAWVRVVLRTGVVA